MKKFYTLIAITAAGVICANAADFRTNEVKNLNSADELAAKVEKATSMTRVNAPQRTAENLTVADFAGEWQLFGTTLLQQGQSSADLLFTLVDEATGEFDITGWPQDFSIKGYLDLTAGTLTIPNAQDLGADSYGDQCYFYFKPVNQSTGSVGNGKTNDANVVGTLNGMTVTFPELSVWAIGDFNNENLGYWWMTYRNTMECITNQGDPNEGWEYYCTAELVDGWIMPAFGLDPEENPWTVDAWRNIDNPDLIRLDNPYKATTSPIANTDYVSTGGYIVVDISDPEFVTVVPNVFCGFIYNGKLSLLNLGGFALAQGLTKEEALQEGIQPATIEAGEIYIPECGFDQNNAGKFYTWQDANGNSLSEEMNSVITLTQDPSAVRTINASATTAPVYYNMQGQKISQPSGLCIRVANGESTKIQVR